MRCEHEPHLSLIDHSAPPQTSERRFGGSQGERRSPTFSAARVRVSFSGEAGADYSRFIDRSMARNSKNSKRGTLVEERRQGICEWHSGQVKQKESSAEPRIRQARQNSRLWYRPTSIAEEALTAYIRNRHWLTIFGIFVG